MGGRDDTVDVSHQGKGLRVLVMPRPSLGLTFPRGKPNPKSIVSEKAAPGEPTETHRWKEGVPSLRWFQFSQDTNSWKNP